MKKKSVLRWGLLFSPFLLLGLALWFVQPKLPIISGYAAKNMCSCVFLACRTPASADSVDLNFSLIKLASSEVDLESKSVTSSVLGMGSRTAYFRKGLGCTLEANEEHHPFAEVSVLMPPEIDQDTVDWPMGNRMNDSIPAGVNLERLQQALDSAFAQSNHTRAVLVAFEDQLVAEQYAEGFDAKTLQLGWSMTKSITSTLVGIRLNQLGKTVNDPPGFEEWANDERNQITLNNLLQMSSGLAWEEDYTTVSDVTHMLYDENDIGKFTVDHPALYPPDSVWMYSSGTTNILAEWLKRSFKDPNEYLNFARKDLFYPAGMYTMTLEADAADTFVGSSYSWATPRDWMRFGTLLLNDGVMNGQRILPEGWVEYCRKPASKSGGIYGAHFWLNANGTDIPDVPADVFACDGFQMQRVFVVPSMKVVVVRLGVSERDNFNENSFLSRILDAFDQAI